MKTIYIRKTLHDYIEILNARINSHVIKMAPITVGERICTYHAIIKLSFTFKQARALTNGKHFV